MNTRTSTPAESDFIDAERNVICALDRSDDEQLWRALRQSPNENGLLQLVAEEAPRLAHRQRRVPFFSELLLLPIVETDRGTVIGNSEAWKAAEQCISAALHVWQGVAVRNTVFRGVLPYEWIAAWEPSMLRHYLAAAAPGGRQQRLALHPAPLSIPEGAPRLGFIAMAVTQTRSWPELPLPDTLRDARFRQVVRNAFATRDGGAPDVLPPDQVSAALVDGLCLWLATLHEAHTIRGWDLSPDDANQDTVKVTLALEVPSEPLVQFNLRKHQVAPVGADCIASMLSALGPRIAAAQVH